MVNRHYLQFEDGTPFFWLGDTGWEMLHKLSREEIQEYLLNRKLKGFNVIQTVLISEFIHMDKITNFYNDSIFINDDPEKPNITKGIDPLIEKEYDYWDHVDFAVETARVNGLYLGLLPSWGEWVTPRTDKPLFNNVEQAYNYGWFLGNRYKDAPNIIWILGGDREPNERNIGIKLWQAMAEGITDGVSGIKTLDGKADYSLTFMTFHAYNSSSNWFHTDEWIDFHTWGSYHAEINNPRSFELAQKDWNLPNPKPTINSEPCYEAASINYAITDNGYFTSTDVRIAAYWSVFSGCAGFTYGCNSIWKFSNENKGWKQELDLPGAVQVSLLKELILSRPVNELRPDQTLILSEKNSCFSYTPVLKGKSHAFIYTPTGNSITVKLGTITGSQINACWFDPRTGNRIPIGTFENKGEKSFDVPVFSKEFTWLKTGRGCDWVLVLDDASAAYKQ
ncbi:MAG: DUF4038 domain-containing protein [Bacteroidales bacterium]|nr:DUF4038 domain-containing protein [Bacteroidales bacterium]